MICFLLDFYKVSSLSFFNETKITRNAAMSKICPSQRGYLFFVAGQFQMFIQSSVFSLAKKPPSQNMLSTYTLFFKKFPHSVIQCVLLQKTLNNERLHLQLIADLTTVKYIGFYDTLLPCNSSSSVVINNECALVCPLRRMQSTIF